MNTKIHPTIFAVLLGHYEEGCILRKLPAEILQRIVKMDAPETLDHRCQGRWAFDLFPPPTRERLVTSVTFWLSRGSKYPHTLYFRAPVTELETVKKAELYLSQPLTKEYYDRVKDDIRYECKKLSYSEWIAYWGDARGSCKGSARFLSINNRDWVEGHLTLDCGS